MSVMPPAVFETPSTGTPACCATGSAACAVFDSVGPMMPSTLSWLISFWKTLMPWALSDASSSKTPSSLALPSWPLALISSIASCGAVLLGRAVDGAGAGHREDEADLGGAVQVRPSWLCGGGR